MSQRLVKIRNPLPEGRKYTDLRNARRLVERGRAKWIDRAVIELCDVASMFLTRDLALTRQRYQEQLEQDREAQRQRGTLLHDWRGARKEAEARLHGPWHLPPGCAVS